MDKFWQILTTVIVGFIIIGVLMNASGASTVMGTFFTGLNNVGTTLRG